MVIVAAALSGFVAALVAPFLFRFARTAGAWIVPLVPLALTVYFAILIEPIANGETITVEYDWVPTLGLSLAFRVDGLSLVFSLLIAGVGTLVMLYAGPYLRHRPDIGRFYAIILVFMAAMLGLVLANNVLAVALFWELTSLSSFFLIGFHHDQEQARAAAWKALMVTALGGQSLLAGLILLGFVSDSFTISEIVGRGDMVRDDALYLPILLLILGGAFTKSAQLPFHFWLPDAMTAPTPVSAYLHSATMVKAGVYILARLNPVLGGTDAWFGLLVGVGGATMVAGAYLAVTQTDIKRMLAYATLSVLGASIFLIGLDTHLAIEAMIVLLIVHSFYKGALFLVAGALDHATGTRELPQLGGLGRKMPLSWAAAILASLSLAGIPPFAGFISKELLYEASLHAPVLSTLLTVGAVLAKILLIVVAGVLAIRPFIGQTTTMGDQAHEVAGRMWASALVLGIAGMVVGVLPDLIDDPLVAPAVASITNDSRSVELHLWPGLRPTLALSALSIAAGTALYLVHRPARRIISRIADVGQWGPARWYDWSIQGLTSVAHGQTRIVQNGYLRSYLLVVIVTLSGLVGVTLLAHGVLIAPDTIAPRPYEVIIAVNIIVGTLVAVLTSSRLGAVAALSIIGINVAIVYVLFGAPDLAMAQFLVDTLTVILFIQVFYRLPRFPELSTGGTRLRDAAVAVTAGALVSLLILIATGVQFAPDVSHFYVETTERLGHSHNIVNAIVTDFRAFDTLGETVVLTLGGIGVFTLLKLREAESEPSDDPASQSSAMHSLVLASLVSLLMPLIVLFSIFLLLHGGERPGGGFPAGLVAAAGFVLFAVAKGSGPALRGLRIGRHLLLAIGLTLMIASGVLGLLLGEPFLTAQWATFSMPALGSIEIGTPLLFDIGIYLAVLGAAMLILLAMWRE